LDLITLGFDLLKLQLQLLLSLEILLLDLLLQPCVELVVGCQELEILLSSGLGHGSVSENILNLYEIIGVKYIII
jgi:hypothetical protein